MRKYWPFLFMIPLIGAAVAGWFLLPDQLVVQIGSNGQAGTVLPKLPALLLPVGLGAVGAGVACGKERQNTGLIILAVAALVTALTFFWNF